MFTYHISVDSSLGLPPPLETTHFSLQFLTPELPMSAPGSDHPPLRGPCRCPRPTVSSMEDERASKRRREAPGGVCVGWPRQAAAGGSSEAWN